MSDSLWPHELQHTGLNCPYCFPEFAETHVHWVGDAIQPSHPVTLFPSCPQSFSASGSVPTSQLFASGGQNLGASASASVLPMNNQGWFHWGLTGLIFLQSKTLSRVLFSTTVQTPLAKNSCSDNFNIPAIPFWGSDVCLVSSRLYHFIVSYNNNNNSSFQFFLSVL